jgi:hypothetical protein
MGSNAEKNLKINLQQRKKDLKRPRVSRAPGSCVKTMERMKPLEVWGERIVNVKYP